MPDIILIGGLIILIKKGFEMWTRDVMARTLWGEARGEGRIGMHAVANVIINRFNSKSWFSAPTVAGVAMKKSQFSVWNKNDPNYEAMINVSDKNPYFVIAIDIADKALSNTLPDVTYGATHYYARNISPPSWTKDAIETTVIGNHIFYKGVA